MLAFLKKWRQAYRDEKGDRLHAEVEAERNALCGNDVIKAEDIAQSLHKKNDFFSELGDSFESQHEEYCRRGYYT
ncbi:hypothetical protein LRP52_42420 [Photobacterium sp. ZSDE20]|uniref:Uncharacterized protein n=1 Tax=Photobacterium pectinilyticum TaxID=2906793 RepID=A0ABT1N9Y3_9GAMM|nr:hypothetical protein [Photobacterium sp. ZSDE20]MCQ1060521.1 hypothetical protein [Photobacterium sp. ZSDE20]MDD1828830.1 hypothetical protein [Photobacterium sp. ZSDE20]